MTLTWATLLVAHARMPDTAPGFPVGRMVLWAVAFRCIGLLAEPVLDDDHYRYLWDGRNFALEGSPYVGPPADAFGDPALSDRFEQVLDGINYPDVPTLYGPVNQYLFLASYWIAPAELWPIKLLLLLADLATLALLLRLVSPRAALLYAWCPLLVKETAFTAHPDSLGILFLVGAVYAWQRHRDLAMAALAALGVGTKVLCLVVLPLLFPRRRGWRALAVFCATLAALYLPFAVSDQGNEAGGLFVFAEEWEFNSTGFALMAALGGVAFAKAAWLVGTAALLVALLAGCGDGGDRAEGRLPRGDLLLAGFFLLSPVVNPWYLLWMLPFVCFHPTAWGLAALAAVSLSYAHGLFLPDSGLPPYHHPLWVRPLEVALVAAGVAASLLGVDLGRRRATRPGP